MTPGPAFRSKFTRAATAAAAALALFASTPAPAPGADPGEAESLSASFRKAAQKVLPAVVTVRAEGAAARPFGPFRERGPLAAPPGFDAEAGGSGVVIDADKGFVLTNDHVVNGAPRVVVILHDGRERPVGQIRRDPRSDLALLVIDARGLARATWGDSSALDTGDWVLAVGQPFGLSDTVTAGIVSGKGRGIGVSSYEDLIQTDAAINPGNSGGPLVNLRGEVVGINLALKSARGGYEGVGFAVPSARARRVADDLARDGRVRRAYLGVAIGPVDPATAERLGRPGAVAVNEVTGASPADKAGVRPGDVIVALQGRPLKGLGDLQGAIEFAPVGEPLTLTVDRGGKTQTVKVSPEALPDRFGNPAPAPEPARPAPRPPGDRGDAPARQGAEASPTGHFRDLGLRLEEPGGPLARRFGPLGSDRGLVVVGVDPDGPADRGGLEPGMVVTDVAGRRVDSTADVRAALAGRPRDRDLLVRILRGSKPEFRVILDRPPGGDTTPRPPERGRDRAAPTDEGRDGATGPGPERGPRPPTGPTP